MPAPPDSDLTSVQRFVLKILQGEELHGNVTTQNLDGRHLGYSEEQFLSVLHAERRSNIFEYNANAYHRTHGIPRRIAIAMGRRAGKTEIVAHLLAEARAAGRIVGVTHNIESRLELIRRRNFEFMERQQGSRGRGGSHNSYTVNIRDLRELPEIPQVSTVVFDEAALMASADVEEVIGRLPNRDVIMISTPGQEEGPFYRFYRTADISLTIPTWYARPQIRDRIAADLARFPGMLREYAAEFQLSREYDTLATDRDFYLPSQPLDPVSSEPPDPFDPIDCYDVLNGDGLI